MQICHVDAGAARQPERRAQNVRLAVPLQGATQPNTARSRTCRRDAIHERPPAARRGTRAQLARHARRRTQSQKSEGIDETEESQDEIEAQLNSLTALAQMDAEAAAAYEAVAEVVDVADVQRHLQAFAQDHRRHVEKLGQLIQELGGTAEAAAPPPEDSTFVRLALALSSMGPRAALLSLVGNEQFTNATYETALELASDAETIALLERNFQDEQRHLSWLSEHTEEEDEEEPNS
jgi:rubrerythrin